MAESDPSCRAQMVCKGLTYSLSGSSRTKFADPAFNRHVLSRFLAVPVTYWLATWPRERKPPKHSVS